ncbi:MAG: hypothetical protein AAFU85_33895, partial [Planctomycetota bacterium]
MSDWQVQRRNTDATYALLEKTNSRHVFECLTDSYRELGIDYNHPLEALLVSATPVRWESSTVHDFDALGNPTDTRVRAQADGVDTAPIETHFTATYVNNASTWFIGQKTSELATQTTPAGSATRISSYTYDGTTGRRTESNTGAVTDTSVFLRTTTSYDRFGNIATVEQLDANNTLLRRSILTFDARGMFPISVENGLGQVVRLKHEPRFGNLTGTLDANGVESWLVFDALGRLRRMQRADGTWSRKWWTHQPTTVYPDANALLTEHTQTSQGAIDAKSYDFRGRPLKQVWLGLRGKSFTQEMAYDGFGQVYQSSRPYAANASPRWTTMTYDRRGRLETVHEPDGTTQAYRYAGTRTWVTDGRSETQSIRRNGEGRIVEVIDPAANTTTYQYGPFGTLLSVDGFGRSITQVFDDYGRRTSVDDPNTGTTIFQIDPLGQVTRMTDGRGMTTETQFDLLGRTVREIRPNSTRTWEYDHGSSG